MPLHCPEVILMEITTKDVKWPETLFPNDEPRQEGVHLGDIIKALMDDSGLGYTGPGFRDMELTAEIGLLWEDILSKVMGDKYASRPPQICEDGVWMSPDGIAPDPEGEVALVVEEFKCTWKSSRSFPDTNFYYMTQVKSYCRALGTNVAIMRVFHIMGDYRGSGPIYRVSRIRFSEMELEQNWEMILKHRDLMVADGRIKGGKVIGK